MKATTMNNERKSKSKNKVKYTVAILGALLGIGAMAYAGAELLKTQRVYQEGDAAYESLTGSLRRGEGAGAAAAEAGASGGGSEGAAAASGAQGAGGTGAGTSAGGRAGGAGTEAGATEREFVPMVDFDALRQINSDAAAWLYGPGTVIDYPVMAAEDYNYYLGHLPDGTKNANGSLFIDYNNEPGFGGPLTVIYGHHMKSGKMFGGLVGYKKQAYYDENPYMYIYTDAANYRLDLIYGCVIDAREWSEQAFMYDENTEELLEFAESNSTFKSSVGYEEGEKLVVLSTCSYEFSDARYFVIGVLRDDTL
ncbi:MAG: class B sortase [Oscillospiraceae bacterium]|nr:class B sortase [Oscillospiraceae bacterium]